MGLTLITPATEYPVTLDEAKLSAKVDGTDRDSEITLLIAAATNYVEQYTGRSIMAQTWKLTLDAFSDSILLPKGPVQSVSSVQYFDANGDSQTVSASDYTLDNSDPAWLVRNSDATWPTTLDGVNVVSVTYVTGYSAVPDAIRAAILIWVTAQVDGNPVPDAFDALLTNYRAFA